MRRVLVISPTYVDPATRGKLRAIAAHGIEVTAGVPQRWRAAPPALPLPVETSWERQSGLEVFPLPTRRVGDLERATFGRRALGALLRDKRPELVQIEAEPGTALARQALKAARRLSIPAVLFTAENLEHPLPLLERWRRRRMLRKLKGLAAGSEAAADLARRRAPSLPVAVLPQLGVNAPSDPVHVPHEGLTLGVVGRLVARKGLDNLLQALALNRQKRWHLTVVGDGPERERLEALASELRLAARIRWSGAVPPDQLTRLWADLDVLVQPSRALPDWQEQNSLVLVEAMVHEVAVVGSASGVIPEIIGDAGLVVPDGDVPALAAALARLADERERREMAKAGRARAMRLYSDEAVADRTIEFWQGLLDSSK